MGRNNGSNQEIKDKELDKKDASTQTTQDSKPIIEVRHSIISPQNLEFAAAIDKSIVPPPFFYPVSQQLYRSASFEIPPSNLPRYLQFYKVVKQGNDFLLRIL